MEFVMGGMAACGAVIFTNPLEVAKTRMQLQGELKSRGHYTVHYRNVFHSFYTIGRVEGLAALQKGLVPALWYQLSMNGIRLGCYQCFINWGLTTDSAGASSVPRCVAAGAVAGCLGGIAGSPPYMVKTQLQAHSAEQIAVGYQHKHTRFTQALWTVMREHGVRGLWRGVTGAIPRCTVGSATQLSTFSMAKQYMDNTKLFAPNSFANILIPSMVSGVVLVAFIAPFDVVSTRMYNQGTDSKGKGLYYRGVGDCFVKMYAKEGLWGFYKGWGAQLFRLGPHTVLNLIFWDALRRNVYPGRGATKTAL